MNWPEMMMVLVFGFCGLLSIGLGIVIAWNDGIRNSWPDVLFQFWCGFVCLLCIAVIGGLA